MRPLAAASPCLRAAPHAAVVVLAAALSSPALPAAAALPPPPPLQLPALPDPAEIKPGYRFIRGPAPARSQLAPLAPSLPAPSSILDLLPPRPRDTVSATEAGVEFAGYFRVPDGFRFVLQEPRRGASDWLALGQGYAGFTVAEFDPAGEILTVRQGERRLRLALKDARVAAPPHTNEVRIVVDAQGRLFVGGESSPSADLQARLDNIAGNIPTTAFHLVVHWPRDPDPALVSRMSAHISGIVRDLPPQLQRRYLSLSWKDPAR